MNIIALNKKASFNYDILEEFVAGIKLEGREIKSLRGQKPSFAGSFVIISGGHAHLCELNIPRYKHDGTPEYNPKRKRLLLLKKAEIARMEGKMSGEGITVVPLSIGFERQWAKVRVALVRGKKKFDKRHSIKEKDEKRRAQQAMKKFSG
ncbi:MAG: SsrA-binding protein SmpB [bacterium]|nr:SsrA-binding protein SmpB [bacterium]